MESSGFSELRKLLVTITKARICDVAERHSAGVRDVNKEAASAPCRDDESQPLAADTLPADIIVAIEDELKFLLDILKDDLRHIADLRMDGLTMQAIAEELGITKKAVINRVKAIRALWTRVIQES